jgi:hypothetical protein
VVGAEVLVFVVAALVIGAVVFGGTTLLYFLGQNAEDSSGRAAPEPREGDPVPVRVDDPHQRDRAA